MKFDVVIGNPPYQSGGKANKLWDKFIRKAISFNPEYISMITPNVWWIAPSKIYKNIEEDMIDFGLKEIHTNYNNYEDKKNVYFKAVGDDIGWFILEKGYKGLVSVDDLEPQEYSRTKKYISLTENDVFKNKINNKMSVGPRLVTIYGDKRNFEDINDVRTKEYNVKVYNTIDKIFYVKEADAKRLTNHSIFINKSGYYWNDTNIKIFKANNKEENGSAVYRINLNSDIECDNMITYLYSNLYKWYIKNNRSSGFISKDIKQLPLLDNTISWTDDMVYKHFKITNEEIKVIEEDLKGIKSI